MNRSLLKKSFMIVSNLKTLLTNPLILKVAIEIVYNVSSSEGDEIAFANLCDISFCTLLSRVEGKIPEDEFKFLEPVLRLLLSLVISLLLLELLVISEVELRDELDKSEKKFFG